MTTTHMRQLTMERILRTQNTKKRQFAVLFTGATNRLPEDLRDMLYDVSKEYATVWPRGIPGDYMNFSNATKIAASLEHEHRKALNPEARFMVGYRTDNQEAYMPVAVIVRETT